MSNSFSQNQKMYSALILFVMIALIFVLIQTGILRLPCFGGKESFEALVPNSTPNSTMLSNDELDQLRVLERPNPPPVEPVNKPKNENELLPVSGTDESAFEFAPQDLQDINFLDTSDRIGLDTVSNTLKNANYSIRPDPFIPKTDVSPWMNSEIDADPLRNSKALM
jgi:hypothetical protein